MKCLICNKDCESQKKLGQHIRSHNITALEYKLKFNLKPRCKKCGGVLKSILLKTGYCNQCRDRTGINNPFFGKKHTNETKNHLSQTSSNSSKKLWNMPQYREKVIKNATGLKRSKIFKKEQSERIIKWFKDNPEQAILRSAHMKRSWNEGKIEPNINSMNESKLERELRASLELKLINRKIEKKTLKIKNRWFYPDIIIDKNIIIEFYGKYWHADPKIFNENDIVHHSITAKNIWESDKKRIDILKNNGYIIYIVWQSDYELDKSACLEKLIKEISENQNITSTI